MSSLHRARIGLIALIAAGITSACGDSSTPPTSAGIAITAVNPAVLRPGDEVTLDGQDFASTAQANEVRIHGIEAEVLSASSTSLRVRLPEFMCVPRGEAPIVVTANGSESDPVLRPFEPVGVLSLEPGELRRIPSPDDRCLLLEESAGDAEYLVGTQSVTEAPGTRTGVLLTGRVPGQPPSDDAAAGAEPTGRAPAGGAGLLAPGSGARPDRWSRHLGAERELRVRERDALRRAVSAPAQRAFSPAAAEVPGTVEPGDTVDLMIPDVSEGADLCEDGAEIEAVVRAAGSRSIWVEDVENPEGGFTSEDYDLLSREFDERIYDEAVSYFGEPTDLDANDRVVIVVSQAVNRTTRALAYVVSSDFVEILGASCPAANGGEYYYARAPDPEGDIPGPDPAVEGVYSRVDALSDSPRLLAHELTHIIQFGRRLQISGLSQLFQAIWLLEGQATFAEEVVGHRYTGSEPRRNLGPFTALDPEQPPTDVAWYATPFFDLAVYYGFDAEEGAPEECTWLSVEDPEPCTSGRIAYGVTWSWLRWLSDHFHDRFPGGEREFHQRLVDSSAWGFATFADVLDEDPAELLPLWAATLYVDERVDGDPLLEFPSWDLADIEEALVAEARLTPDVFAFEHFETEATVAAASSYYQLIAAPEGHPSFAMSARTPAGDPLPDHMQLWVVRIR